MVSIALKNLSLSLPVYQLNTRSLKNEIVRLTSGGMIHSARDNRVVTIKALDNISLTIPNGMRVGLIGHNGSGKSTLLRVIAGIYETKLGQVAVQGKVTSLLDMNLGMVDDATGEENIMMHGLLNGLTRHQIKRKQQEIAEFTELGDYLKMPIHIYSTGMRVRLAFGVATSIEAQILLLDEIIGAGDAVFFNKAHARLQNMIDQSEIVLIASHSHDIIEKICDKVIWLDHGKLMYYGDVKQGLLKYLNMYK
jgi:ABC-type polysaccharide/polyol phosphate transport system ATPase subunit